MTVARGSRADHGGLSVVSAPGKLNIEAATIGLRHLGAVRQEAFLPQGRAVFVIVAVAAFVEDHAPGRIEDEIGRAPAGQIGHRHGAGFLSILIDRREISPTASSPLASGVSGLALSESMPVGRSGLPSSIHRLPADGLEQGKPAGGVVAAGRVDVMEALVAVVA